MKRRLDWKRRLELLRRKLMMFWKRQDWKLRLSLLLLRKLERKKLLRLLNLKLLEMPRRLKRLEKNKLLLLLNKPQLIKLKKNLSMFHQRNTLTEFKIFNL